ncbi:MAG: VWA domain-containing protein [Clostridiales bacterium]|nr:VWA domain-containing protein [Clostridiales bacterium]
MQYKTNKMLSIFIMTLLLVGCSKNTENNDPVTVEENETLVEQNTIAEETVTIEDILDEAVEAVWKFEAFSGSWSLDTPLVNPFGDESNYSTIEFMEHSEMYAVYVNPSAVRIEETFMGDLWTLRAPFKESLTDDENKQLLYDITSYFDLIGGNLMGRYYDSVTYQVITDNERYVCSVEIDDNEFLVTVVKEKLLLSETEYIFRPSEEESPIYLTVYKPADCFYSLRAKIDQGFAYLDINNSTQYGLYKREYSRSITLDEEMGYDNYFDNLPLDQGFYHYEITWDNSNPPNEISLELNQLGTIPIINHGERLGAIKVSAEDVYSIEVIPTNNDSLYVEHPSFDIENITLDETPDGDHIIYIPSGFWNVIIHPLGDPMVFRYETLMVPVNSGQVTEVIIPPSVSDALQKPLGFDAKDIVISKISESADQVSFEFTLIDEKTKDILPSIENTTVYDGGYEGEITKIESVKIPPSIILLVDSSGSMKGKMKETLDACKTFITSMEDDVKIQLIDFDSSVKKLNGVSKEEVLSNISQITVGGATLLYDAISEGLDELALEERPIIVVFTDGADANLNDTKRGSELTKEELLLLTEVSKTPIYCIGFGKGHDEVTLEEIALSTEGQYFSAADTDVLVQVFDAINKKISNTYAVTYDRPRVQSFSDVPIISFVVDTSGSMETYDLEYGHRMRNVQFLIHEFMKSLPENCQYQVTEFNGDTRIVQTLTSNKTLVYQGIGRLTAGGATDIEGSVSASYNALKNVPSTKKVMVYITDAALGTTGSSDYFKELLTKMGSSDVRSLWVGIGVDDYVEDFVLASELSGGDYVISESVDTLKESFDKVLNDVLDAPTSELTTVHLNIEKTNASGEREVYSVSQLADLTLKNPSGEIFLSEAISYKIGDRISQYDQTVATLISGRSVPMDEFVVKTRMSADVNGNNEAVDIKIEELFILNKISGVEAPSGYQYIGMQTTVKNILPKQEVMVYPDGSGHPASWVAGGAKGELKHQKIAYMIPNFISHFYLRYNDEISVPASTATWLMNEPLVTPGNYALTIEPDGKASGLLVFIVPEKAMTQSSLHFYDTNYGHIEVPIVGVLKSQFDLEKFPVKADDNLTDLFGLSVISELDNNDINQVKSGDDTTFKVVTANFTSQVQALLDLNPIERIFIRSKTDSGDFYFPIHSVTNLLPSGFVQPRMIAPGSNNVIKWAFEMPDILKTNKTELYMDVYKSDYIIDVREGDILSSQTLATYEHEFFDLVINDLVKTEQVNDVSGKFIVADITVQEKKDGFSTSGITSYFSIVTEAYGEGEYSASANLSSLSFDENKRLSSHITDQLLLGLTDESICFDGTSRRGFIVFELPDESELDWSLYAPDLDLKLLPTQNVIDERLLAFKYTFDTDETYDIEMQEALSKAVESYQLVHPEKDESLLEGKIVIDKEFSNKNNISVPMISSYGSELISSIKNVNDLIDTFRLYDCILSEGSKYAFEHSLSTESFMIQQLGNEQDFAHATIELLSKLGYKPRQQLVRLTDDGKKALKKITGIDEVYIDTLPAIRFVLNNEDKILIMPFMAYASEMSSLIYLDAESTTEMKSDHITLSVSLVAELTEKGHLQQMGDITDALSGDTTGESLVEITMFEDYLDLDMLSLDAIDVGIGLSNNKASAYILTPYGELYGDETIDVSHYNFKQLVVKVRTAEDDYYHTTDFTEEMKVDEVFLTLSINAPDLGKKSVDYLNDLSNEIYNLAEQPNEISTLKWYGRSMIAKYIYEQSNFDNQLMEDLDLIASHLWDIRIICFSTSNRQTYYETKIDLMQPFKTVHKGSEDAIKSFNIMTGLYASTLESNVLNNGYGLLEIWGALDKDTEFMMMDTYMIEDMYDDITALGIEEKALDYMIDTGNIILMPKTTVMIDGVRRYAWLEMNPQTYRTIAVLDDFSKGSAVETTIIDIVKNSAQYAVGGFKGVETSIWSVAAFSLEESDYDVILKKAKAFALSISKRFSTSIGGVGGSIGGSKDVGPVTFSAGTSGVGVSQNVLGFTQGFVEGINFYFDIAK